MTGLDSGDAPPGNSPVPGFNESHEVATRGTPFIDVNSAPIWSVLLIKQHCKLSANLERVAYDATFLSNFGAYNATLSQGLDIVFLKVKNLEKNSARIEPNRGQIRLKGRAINL